MGVARRAIRLRAYPTRAQQDQILVSCAGAAYVWNKALEWRESAFLLGSRMPGVYEMDRLLPALKRAEPWLRECESSCLKQALRHLDAAYRRAFQNVRCKSRVSPGGNPYGFPRYKSRKRGFTRSYRVTNNPCRVAFLDERHIRLPKLGVMRVRGYRSFQGRITGATIKSCASGRFEVVLHVECENMRTIGVPTQGVVGVDVGSRKLAVTSGGRVFENPRSLEARARRLARLQRDLSRKQRGSKNYERCRQRVAREHERIGATRSDAQHKASLAIVRDSQAIVVETLNVKGMLRNRRVARTLADAGVSEVLRQLRYKSEWYGRVLLEADQWFASSKTCSACGTYNGDLRSEEHWVCPVCGTRHDRDLNASRNLESYGRSLLATRVSAVGRDTPEPATETVANACGEPSGGDSDICVAV